MVEIKAREGYYLSDPNKEHFYTAISGADVSADDYIEVPVKEAEEIMRRRNAEAQITTIEELDNAAFVASVVPDVINTFDLSDEEARKRKDLYPEWAAGISVVAGEKYRYGDNLWQVVQPHTTQAGWEPGIYTASLWKVIDEQHAGTAADPIPYTPPMEIFNGKYYTQNGVKYLCTRDSGIALSHDLSALVGLYVQIAQ